MMWFLNGYGFLLLSHDPLEWGTQSVGKSHEIQVRYIDGCDCNQIWSHSALVSGRQHAWFPIDTIIQIYFELPYLNPFWFYSIYQWLQSYIYIITIVIASSGNSPKVCQMSSWWMKDWLHSINIWDTVTNVVPLCPVYQAPSYEPNPTLLAPYLYKNACLSMLLILEMACSASSTGHLKNILKWVTNVQNGASEMRVASYDDFWCTEHNGTTSVTVSNWIQFNTKISQILMGWGQFVMDTVWRDIILHSIKSDNTKTITPVLMHFTILWRLCRMLPKLCQMLSWRTKNWAHYINISDNVTMWYHDVHYIRRHLMSLIPHCWPGFCQTLLIWACYLFLRWPALLAVQVISRINIMLK